MSTEASRTGVRFPVRGAGKGPRGSVMSETWLRAPHSGGDLGCSTEPHAPGGEAREGQERECSGATAHPPPPRHLRRSPAAGSPPLGARDAPPRLRLRERASCRARRLCPTATPTVRRLRRRRCRHGAPVTPRFASGVLISYIFTVRFQPPRFK